MKYRLMVRFVLLYKKRLLVLALLSLASSVFPLCAPYLSKLFIDNAFVTRDAGSFLSLSAWAAAVFVFSTVLKTVGDIIAKTLEEKTKFSLANMFLRKFYSLDLAVLQSRAAGENVYRFYDTEQISQAIVELFPAILADSARLIIMLGISLWINAGMTALLLVLSPLFLLHSVYMQKRLSRFYMKIWEQSAQLSKDIHESFSKIQIIKAFGLEQFTRRLYLRALIINLRWKLKNFRLSVIGSVSSSVLSKAVYGAVCLYGGWLIIKGAATIGSYTAVILYLTQIADMLQSLSSRYEYMGQRMVSLERFIEVMENEPAIKDLPGAVTMSSFKGKIGFKDVWFGYGAGPAVLKGVTFTIPECSWAAITGPSGCGKTTMINLILRLYEPLNGEISFDGVDIRKIRLRSLRERVGIATQQPVLFNVSAAENIAYGLRNVSRQDVIRAAETACIHDSIILLPQGYDTVVGEDAHFLSHGMKQRVAIARALLREPDILILDEAASSVDAETEFVIFKSIRARRKGLITIVITHRVSSIRDADWTYSFKSD